MRISQRGDCLPPYNIVLQAFKDKNVLITGAGRGIGKRLAIGFAAHGAKLGLLARSKSELDLAQLEIEHAGGIALRLRADVRDPDQILTAIDRMVVHYGSIDIVICAAGIQGPIGPMAETPLKAWIETLETNLFGVVNVCRAVLPAMVTRRAGKILVLSGGGAATARPNFTAYSASKAAVVRMVESLAEEVRDHNVQVNCMAPGGAYTSMTDEILHAGEKAGWKEIEVARQVRITGGVTAEKQIELALFLTSERANHISGKMVHVRDHWKKLERENVNPELYTLRRVQRV
jgi:NAD(P)-dependent dehydrogenase (short-subunit alcohol dehydrogenase family)